MLIPSAQELALYIKSQRKRLKLSQAEVASLVGLQQKTISAIENNPDNIKLATLFRILAALEIAIKVIPKQELNENPTSWDEEW